MRHSFRIPLLLCLGFLQLAACSTEYYSGPVSDHFDGTRFDNQVPTRDKTVWDLIRWRVGRETEGPWRQVEIPGFDGEREERIQGARLLVTMVNHSTVLLQTSGVNILTDPIWSRRTSPIQWIGPARYHAPGIAFEDLPPIDAVVVSHNHYDHLDLPTLARLHESHAPVFLVGLGNGRLLRDAGIEGVVELDWWQARRLNDAVKIHAVPAQHWSTRTRLDINRMLWAGYVVEGPGGSIFFAGDTGLGPHFAQIRQRFSPVRLALLPIGAYLPRWMMKDNHLSPAEALDVHQILNANRSMAIHFGTFELGDDGQFQAVRELKRLRGKSDIDPDVFWIPEVGIPREVDEVYAPAS